MYFFSFLLSTRNYSHLVSLVNWCLKLSYFFHLRGLGFYQEKEDPLSNTEEQNVKSWSVGWHEPSPGVRVRIGKIRQKPSSGLCLLLPVVPLKRTCSCVGVCTCMSEHVWTDTHTGKERKRAESPGLRLGDCTAGCPGARVASGGCCSGLFPYLGNILIEV